MILKKIKKNILNKDEKGFVILIAIMVSLILLSVGAFIASVAVREIMLSSSAKQSQAAFFAADSVLECALFKEFKKGGFKRGTNYANHNIDNSLSCNDKNFDWENSLVDGDDVGIHIYYISFSDSINDEDGNGLITKQEIEDDLSTSNKPFVKLIVSKPSDYNETSEMQVYGHNFREGRTIIERAIEVVW
ncbi:MAG TPA: hypothetical protein EYG89_01645 [Bacteroidia bacterium]|nr:hypothetical protein [Bacteroidia bacterium]